MEAPASDRLDPVFGPGPGKPVDGPPAYPPLTLGRFIIEREVGRGRNSVVYRSVDPKDQGVIALKVLYPGQERTPLSRRKATVQREAKRLRALSHPGIVGVREAGVLEGHAYIAYPFVKGVSLAQALSSGTLDRDAALAFMAQAARAVHYAHERGLIHRDLKPANILVGLNGEPHVLDFGLSLQQGEKLESGVQTIVGTPPYMSPEQARGEEKHLTPATDVYGLGAILYEVLTGRPPFAGETPWRTMLQVMNVPPTPPHELTSTVDLNRERVVLWCLEKEPGKRYPSAAQLAEDLERLLQGDPPRGPRGDSFFSRLFKS